jgi:predicted acetylornithine/succinylornithine family transaminase
MSFDELAALDAAHVMGTYARLPVAFVRGEGSRLWDSEGREYLDFLGGLAVTSLGHAHPEVAEALAEQARTLLHVSNLYYNDVQPKLAAELDGLLGGGGRVFFANSGAEANECAIKLARRHGQKRGVPHTYHVVSALQSFHGRTLSTLAATGQPAKQAAFQPLPPGFWQVPYGDIVLLEEQAERVGEKLAAVMLEVVQGEGGVWPAPPGYLEGVRALCDRTGALLILDEVQTGLGRTGKWFAFEHFGIRPDVVTMAKALGNGVPIGGCWATAEAAAAFEPGDHATTFGGNPVACAAACAVVDAVDEALLAHVREVSGYVRDGLAELGEVRGLGLLLAVELDRPAAPVVEAALAHGLVIGSAGERTLRLTPPLTLSRDEASLALTLLEGVLA